MRAGAAISISFLLIVAGCKLNTDYFSEYRGKNLLANYGFSATNTGPPVTNKWNLLSDATLTAAGVGYQTTDYMTWEKISNTANSDYSSDLTAGTPTTGLDGSPSYRLEIKNLLPDGDFEAVGDTGTSFAQSFWSANVAADATFNATTGTDSNGVPTTISHNTLLFGSVSPGDILTLNVSNAVSTMAARTGNYRFHMDFYNASANVSVPIALTNPSADWSQTVAAASTTLYSVSEEFAPSGSPSIAIGSASNQNTLVYIDNVRIVYTSIDPSVYMALPTLESGGLTLLPGTKSGDYVFTFYVRDDPTADETAAYHVGNRLYPSGVTVRFNAAQQPGSQTPSPVFIARDSTWATGWKKITVSAGFNFVESDSQIAAAGKTNALEIYLSPTETNSTSSGGPDAGSLLIAQPSLVFNP